MIVNELVQLIHGTVLSSTADLSAEVNGCGAADLMSDVLASLQPEAVLLTGLCNPQVIRTAQMADITAVVVVRGKVPPKDTIDLADLERIPLISTPMGLYEVCGRLFEVNIPCLEGLAGNEACRNDLQ